jgi:predicted heme/steroid binding protein
MKWVKMLEYLWPIAIVLALGIGFYTTYSALHAKMTNRIIRQKFTLDEIRKYDGSNNKSYIAVDGLVFDVSEAKFYKPGGPYAMFAGRDASVALAKMSFEPQWLEMPLKDAELDEVERTNLTKWRERFIEKRYPVVGELVYQEHDKSS